MPAPDHDCPHCSEARAIAEQLRQLLVEGHAILARLQARERDFEPHPAPPGEAPTNRFHNGG